MKDDAKCFVKVDKGIYEEITYKELEERRNKKSEYKNKKFIPIQGMLIEVDNEQYKDFYKNIERHKYYKKLENKLHIYSLDELKDNKDIKGKDIISDDSIDIEFEVETKLEIEQLRKALLQLTEKEYQIIKALFYEEKTVRECAKTIGIPFTTMQYRKKQILEKLKKILKI